MASDPKKHDNVFPISQESEGHQKLVELPLQSPALLAKYHQLKAEYEKLLHEKNALQLILNGILTSSSWRATAPLRSVAHIKRKSWPIFRLKKEELALVETHDVEHLGSDQYKTNPGAPFIAFSKKRRNSFYPWMEKTFLERAEYSVFSSFLR